MRRLAVPFLLAIATTLPQDPPRTPANPPAATPAAVPAAAPADVESVDAIVRALYAVISGPAGERRDWDRMRSLFHRDARLVPLLPAQGARPGGAMHLTVDDYVRRSGPMLERDGFFEVELARREERYGDLAHVWSTYEARQTKDGAPLMRGINSIQLVRESDRWFVLQVVWQSEHEQLPLPPLYLPAK